MVLLYHSVIPVGSRAVFYSFKLFLPAFAALRGRGRGSAPCVPLHISYCFCITPSLALLYQYQIHSKLVSVTRQFNKILPPSQIVMFELLWLSSKAYLKIFLSLLLYLSSTSGAVCNFIMFIFGNRRQNKRITIKDEIVYICYRLI
jgi:hypothetical protein